jgi:hypothetical protein
MEATDFDQIAKKHGIILILQFGSSVTGKVHARSDVDLLHDLQSRFPTQEVDLALLNRADPPTRASFCTARLRDGTPICRQVPRSPPGEMIDPDLVIRKITLIAADLSALPRSPERT